MLPEDLGELRQVWENNHNEVIMVISPPDCTHSTYDCASVNTISCKKENNIGYILYEHWWYSLILYLPYISTCGALPASQTTLESIFNALHVLNVYDSCASDAEFQKQTTFAHRWCSVSCRYTQTVLLNDTDWNGSKHFTLDNCFSS